jgi:putative salt-induced outer membrane protein YdiY
MCIRGRSLLAFLLSSSALVSVYAQTQPDVLVFTNGEKLVGHLVRTQGKSVTFKSDMVGEVTVDWSKIQELQSSGQFALIQNGVKLRGAQDAASVPQGTLTMTGQRLTVTPAAGQPTRTVPVSDAANVVTESAFQNAIHHLSIWQAWKGTLTGGVSIISATQNSRTLTSNIALIRAVPTESWLAPRDRTLVDFSSASGKLTQPNTPDIKTSIYHADAERDEYFTPRLYGFGHLAYDHNFSQGLDLQQTYGGGIGYTLINTPAATLDLKGNIDYVRQAFQISSQNHNLIASSVSERYSRTLFHGIVVNEQLSFVPALNEPSATSALGTAGITLPVYKRLGLNANLTDAFLNDPPPGFKKNSLQFTTGVTYTLP